MKNFFDRVKSRFASGISFLSQRDEDSFEATFNSAKKLSDFVGMIIRLSFVMFAQLYFLHLSQTTAFPMSFVAGFCFVSATWLIFALAGKIVIIILDYEWREVPRIRGNVGKFIILTFGLLSTIIAYVGIYQMARSIALASSLLSPP
jgi:hypothetical protein